MADQINSGDFVTFVRKGGIPVTYGRTFVRITTYGGKTVTYVIYAGTPIYVDRVADLPEEIKAEPGY